MAAELAKTIATLHAGSLPLAYIPENYPNPAGPPPAAGHGHHGRRDRNVEFR